MVIYNNTAIDYLTSILYGLKHWKKYELTEEHILNYVDDITDSCDKLDRKTFHFNNKFSKYKKYGEKIHNYKRNKQTQWYVFYNIDRHGNIFINHIISNHIKRAETN